MFLDIKNSKCQNIPRPFFLQRSFSFTCSALQGFFLSRLWSFPQHASLHLASLPPQFIDLDGWGSPCPPHPLPLGFVPAVFGSYRVISSRTISFTIFSEICDQFPYYDENYRGYFNNNIVVVILILGWWNDAFFLCASIVRVSLSPSPSLSLCPSTPSPWYPLYKLLATSNVLLSLVRFCFLEVVLCIKLVFFSLVVVYSALFLARVCLCIRVSLFFFNVNNYFLEQIFFLGDI